MRNLKKLLAVITVVAIMATLFVIPASAASLSDVAGTAYESAVTRLNALGIITGREDGKFYPNDTITRAEFAAVVIRSLGYGTAADSAKGQTKFSDVKADFWASGYINLASSLGIIKGRPDGTFGANDKVLYEEAVTMVVRSLGYEPAASANGGYPTGYLTIASQEDIDDGAVAAVGSPASRGIVAKMVDNSLEVAMMVQTGYGTEQKFVKSGTEGTTKQTILDTKLKLDVREAVVQSVDLAKNQIKVKMTTATTNGDDKGSVKTYSVFAGVPFVGLENATITLWVKDGVAYNIDTDTKVIYDYILKVGGEDNTTYLDYAYDAIQDVDLKNNGAGYDVSEDDNGKANFKLYIDGVAAVMNTADSAQTLLNKFAKIYVDDGKIVRMEAYTMGPADVGLITKVDTSTLTITRGKDEGKKLTQLTDVDNLTVVIDGKAAKYSDLKADMLLQYKIIDSENYVFVASTKTLAGKLTAAKSGKLYIDGTGTDLADTNYRWFSTDNGDGYNVIVNEADVKDMLGTAVSAYVNYRGKIVYVKGEVEATTDFYGIVTNANSFNDQLKVARNVDGELKTVTYDTDLPSSATAPYQTYDEVYANYTGHTAATAANRTALLYKFSINADGVVTKAKLIGTDSLADVQFNKDSDYIKDAGDVTRIYTDGATFFQVDGADIKLLKWADIEGTTVPATGLDIAYNTGDVTPDVILLNDTTAGITFTTSDVFVGYVKDMALAADDDYSLTMNTPTGEQTFKVDDGDIKTAAEKKFVLYRLASDGYAKMDVVSTTYSNLAINSGNYASVSNRFIANNGVDGSTLKIRNAGNTADDTTVYALASDAVVYKYNSIRNSYTLSDISEADEDATDGTTSSVSFITYKGKIKMLIFWNE